MCALALQGLDVQEWCLCAPSPLPHPAECTENTNLAFVYSTAARGWGGQEETSLGDGGDQQGGSRRSRRERYCGDQRGQVT